MKYAAKKTAMMLLTMVIVSFLAFLAFQIIPGDAAVNKLGSDATVEAVQAAVGAEVDGVYGAETNTKVNALLDRAEQP